MSEAPVRRAPRRPTGSRQVWLLIVGVATAAAGLHLALLRGLDGPVGRAPAPWWAFALGFFLAEACVVHVQFGRQAHSFGLGEIPLVLGLFLADPQQLIVARLLGSAVALVVVRRQPLQKLAFNTAQWWLGTVVVIVLWRALAGRAEISDPRTWGATVLVVAVAELVATLAIAAAIRLREGALPTGLLSRGMVEGQLVSLANVSFGLLAIDVLLVEWRGVWALAVLAAALYLANRAHVKLKHRHHLVERLNEFTRDVGSALHLDATVADVLRKTRALLLADSATLTLDAGFTGSAATGSSFRCDAEGVRTAPAPATSDDVLTVPLDGADGRIGTLQVQGRLGDVGGFSRDDARLLQAIARHASGCLNNGRLADQLREQASESEHRSLHDSLTGLANRVLFTRSVARTCADGRAAVLLLDLNRFKEVNDTLGHESGDDLLREVASRLLRISAHGACVSRLGGDEFGLLLPSAGEVEALAYATRIRAVLMDPLPMSGISFRIEASIGIALSPEHGTDAPSLLRRADVAMYVAKSTRTPAQIYTAQCDVNSAARLALVSDLRWALLNDEFRLQYQPQAGLADGSVKGLEALIRWDHLERGLVGPDVFIPVAEQVGLIGDITDWVLRTALGQCRTWQDDGTKVAVAVNVSPATLHDADFVRRIEQHLREAGVPPHRLTLEITEGAVMRDPVHAMHVLQELRMVGVRLAIDDLGAGQSSLTYLRRLPVDEVKIDKSFVMGMSEVPDDDAIVCALVNLVHTLRLPVVAEGVEDEQTWLRLREIGCDTAQGYWLARPLDAHLVPAWLQQWGSRIDLTAVERDRPRLTVAGGSGTGRLRRTRQAGDE